MIRIEIMPSARGQGGYYSATGHAEPGKEAVCTAVTAIEECLAANLDNTWHINVHRTAAKGNYFLRWTKSDKNHEGLRRANLAAGFAYTGLKRLAREYPDVVKVEWKRAEINERRNTT